MRNLVARTRASVFERNWTGRWCVVSTGYGNIVKAVEHRMTSLWRSGCQYVSVSLTYLSACLEDHLIFWNTERIRRTVCFYRCSNVSVCWPHLVVFIFGATATQWARASSFTRFLDHTTMHHNGRTPLDEWSACRRDIYLTALNTYNRQTSMLPVGFEPTISAGERPHA